MAAVGTRILTVEDDERIRTSVKLALEDEGWQVLEAETGEDAIATFTREPTDVVLIDIMLPGIDGFEVCRSVRRLSDVPIIMVTARASEIDTVVGLEVGADDYVTKPYRLRELVARMRAVLRRHPRRDGHGAPAEPGGGPGPVDSFEDVLVVGDVELDLDRHELRVRGEAVSVPLKEFELLTVLMENAGRVMPRSTLIDRVWGSDYVGDTKTLDVHVKRLRAKVEPDPSHPTLITTIRGLGYKFAAPRP